MEKKYNFSENNLLDKFNLINTLTTKLLLVNYRLCNVAEKIIIIESQNSAAQTKGTFI